MYEGMIGIGCTIGLSRMMRISRGVTEAELVDSLNANYSFKYFGKDQGVAAYTFRDEREMPRPGRCFSMLWHTAR